MNGLYTGTNKPLQFFFNFCFKQRHLSPATNFIVFAVMESMSSSSLPAADNIVELRKQLDELTEQNRALQTENCSLQALVTAGGIREQAMLAMHEKATEIFARQVGRKRSRSSTPPPPSASNVASEAERQAGIDRYVEGVLELRDATHARAVEELKKAHKAETDKLRAKAREPVNEFRESKRFHIREAELKAEVEKAKRALEAEKERAKSMEFEQVDPGSLNRHLFR